MKKGTKFLYSEERKKEITAKRKATNAMKYGEGRGNISAETRALQNARIMKDGRTYKEHRREQFRINMAKKYGDAFYNNTKKAVATRAKKTEEEKADIIKRTQDTNLKKYGVINALLLPENRRKINSSNGNYLPYRLPSGREVQLRGYEHRALDGLLLAFEEDEIVIQEPCYVINQSIPLFDYVAVDNHKRRYVPDFYLPKQKRIIEVKSLWWFNGCGRPGYESRIENNMRKHHACLNQGYLHEFWIYSNHYGLPMVIR